MRPSTNTYRGPSDNTHSPAPLKIPHVSPSHSSDHSHSTATSSPTSSDTSMRLNIDSHRGETTRDSSILIKALILLSSGAILGIVMPKNDDLPTPHYRTASSIIGYTYFVCWTASFYPQVLTNHRRRSTVGLSPDFTILNVVGFICYSIYSAFLFWGNTAREEYRTRNAGNASTVQSNDVAFAFHAIVLSCFYMAQILYFRASNNDEGRSKCASILAIFKPWTIRFVVLISLACIVFPILVYRGAYDLQFLDYLYFLSSIKLAITIMKYIPQVLLNYHRKSTEGWNIWNVLLDLSGGVLSTLQVVLDCVDIGDWSGITGNWTKFGLGFITIVYDTIFIVQHYVLYSNYRRLNRSESSTSAGHLVEEELLVDDKTIV